MSIFEAFILGAVQGLTEFLPISSSGHLVIFQSILGVEISGNQFEILVHLGTLMSVILVFKKELKDIFISLSSKRTKNFILYLVLGTTPAALFGIGFKDFLMELFDNPFAVGIALIFTGSILIITFFIKASDKPYSFKNSFLIGFAQAIAIIPGISRSGMTISAALILGISPQKSAQFSFILAIPVISGATLITLTETNDYSQILNLSGFIALLTSFAVGYISLKWLLKWIESGKLYIFGSYCIIIGLITINF